MILFCLSRAVFEPLHRISTRYLTLQVVLHLSLAKHVAIFLGLIVWSLSLGGVAIVYLIVSLS